MSRHILFSVKVYGVSYINLCDNLCEEYVFKLTFLKSYKCNKTCENRICM